MAVPPEGFTTCNAFVTRVFNQSLKRDTHV
uniref:Uncharacterized protein n=1 Tax=Anguilla anguilla TaxID=7936 RepID=A0A0E9SUZ1_ANGAN